MVKIDGQWYHVDVTWDDPVPDKPGRVSHENFLRSDDGIRSTGHYGWTSDYTCTSTKYDKYLWKDATSPLVYLKGKWYYMDEIYKGLFEYDIKTNTGNELFWIKESWPVVDKPGYTYMGC